MTLRAFTRRVSGVCFVSEPRAECRNYDSMRPYGPNDGVTLLADEILPQGHVVLAIGADHRFVDPRTDLKTLALASLIIELVDLRR